MQWPQRCWWTYHGRKTKYSCKSVTMILFLLPLFLFHAILLFLLLQILLKFHSFFETLSVHFGHDISSACEKLLNLHIICVCPVNLSEKIRLFCPFYWFLSSVIGMHFNIIEGTPVGTKTKTLTDCNGKFLDLSSLKKALSKGEVDMEEVI